MTLSKMQECVRGEHDKCPETVAAAPNEFGVRHGYKQLIGLANYYRNHSLFIMAKKL